MWELMEYIRLEVGVDGVEDGLYTGHSAGPFVSTNQGLNLNEQPFSVY